MEKIAVKTKIKFLTFVGQNEKIGFDTLDFSPDQVGEIDRLIRNNKEDKVRMTIEAENKQLRYAPVVSEVRLVSMNCMGAGQKIKIADFKSPVDRASTMKEMIAGDVQVTVTLEQIQSRMFDEAEDDEPRINTNKSEEVFDDNKTSDDFEIGDREYKVNEAGVITNPEVITVKLPKSYGTMVAMSLGKSNDNWYFGYDLRIGHDGHGNPCMNDGGENIYTAMSHAKKEIFNWIDLHKDYKYAKQAKAKIEKALQKWEIENFG